MSLMLSRLMTTFTLMCALFLGVAGVRVFTAGQTELVFDSSYLDLLDNQSIKTVAVAETIEAPEMSFEEIKIQAEKKIAKAAPAAIKKVTKAPALEVKPVQVAHNELPFYEPVILKEISYQGDLLQNMVALYQGLPAEEKFLVAETSVKDEVKTTQAAEEKMNVDAEPEFFEYDKKEEVAGVVPASVNEAHDSASEDKISHVEVAVNEMIQPATSAAAETKVTEQEDNFIAFDYSGLEQDIRNNKVPTISMIDTKPQAKKHKKMPVVSSHEKYLSQHEKSSDEAKSSKSLLVAPKFQSQMTIQGVATDLKSTQLLQGFEVRFQDNSSETHEDYGDGEVTVTFPMARSKMTRSMVLLKRGFAPTNTDLILEDGAGSVSVPAISEELVNELLAPYESKGAVGALLVELADETEKATVDVPFGKVITLDGDLRETKSEDFRYQLFVGIKAGNALLSYVHGNEITNKIVHIHEREVTYESNFFEKENLNRVSLFQEELLSREKSPLVTASQNVKVFAKNAWGEKLNQNTYKINFGKALLGGRNYLELGHEAEPVFVGTKNETELSIPSENFMRHILSSLPESKLGNRCVVQVNLKKKVAGVEVAAESVGQSLMTSVQFLDSDGQFYESASGKTRKVIIFGENQGSDDYELTGKVNIKIEYVDGTFDFLGSYCSPNTYLVEQL